MKKMNQNFIRYLPSEILIKIMSRLCVETIIHCKCVCKSWHDLVELARFDLSKPVYGLALTVVPEVFEKSIEVTNVLDIQHQNLPDLHFSTITKLNFGSYTYIEGSADGLLLMRMSSGEVRLCNPVTREYINLRHSHSQHFDNSRLGFVIYGFGVSKISGEYKAVGIFHDQTKPRTSRALPEPAECQVYTIGTGKWRSVAPDVGVRYNQSRRGALVNGNLHWMADDLHGNSWISCFDLETELFSTFSPPFPKEKTTVVVQLVAVEGRLCFCEYTSKYASMIIIWLMKEYGVEKSWTKVLVIGKCLDLRSIPVYPIRVSKEGIILMARHLNFLFYYSCKNKTTQRICNSERCVYVTSHSHNPSSLSLECFTMENSISY